MPSDTVAYTNAFSTRKEALLATQVHPVRRARGITSPASDADINRLLAIPSTVIGFATGFNLISDGSLSRSAADLNIRHCGHRSYYQE